MIEYLTLTIVIAVSLYAHVWLFLFLRFKVDEAVILRYLNEKSSQQKVELNVLAKQVSLRARRIKSACMRSRLLRIESEYVMSNSNALNDKH